MKLKRFLSIHRRLIRILLVVLIAAFNFIMYHYNPDISIILLILIDVVFVIATSLLLYRCFASLFSKPIAELNNKCNPYPLIEECEKHLNANYSTIERFVLFVNYSAALKSAGQYEKALNVLLSIDIEQDAMKNFQHFKAAYYYRLFDLCEILKKKAQADFAYAKFTELIPQIKNEKYKKTVEIEIANAKVLDAYRRGDYQTVVELLDGSASNIFSSQVYSALTCAKAYIELGKTEKARGKLEYVIENGNKMNCVAEAQELLNKI